MLCRREMGMSGRVLGMMLAAAAAAGLVAAGLSGCMGASAHPALGTETALNNPNAPSTHDVAATALRWVVRRYPPTGDDGRVVAWEELDTPAAGESMTRNGVTTTVQPRFIINLPEGTRRSVYDRVIRTVGHGAAGPTPENTPYGAASADLPIYHVTRVWVRGDEAKVDVLRPVVGIGTGEAGAPLYQAVTVQLRGGIKPWAVTAGGAWSLGMVEAPPIWHLPPAEPMYLPNN